MQTEKILIVLPDLNRLGGIESYFLKLQNKFSLQVDYFPMARRPTEKNIFATVNRLVTDYFNFIKKLKNNNYNIIHVNPSFEWRCFIREGLFLLISHVYKKKTVVFFRGWQKSFEKSLEKYWLWFFKLIYTRVNACIVLSNEFKKMLRSWGYKNPIYQEVTIIDDKEVTNIDINYLISKRQNNKRMKLLFLARIVKEKGLYETIEAFNILQKKQYPIDLVIAGDGSELESVKSFVNTHSIPDIYFIGFVIGEEKNKLLKNSHILCLPSYSEGLPNSIIESMAFGLPVVTRPVGGIADFFENGEHGFITCSKEPKILAGLIEKLLVDIEMYKRISLNNYHYAQSMFLSSDAVIRLQNIYRSL